MKIASKDGQTTVLFEEQDERVVWQIVAARIRDSNATLQREFVKAVEDMTRLARNLREDPIIRRQANGEQWTFRTDAHGQLTVEIEGGG